MLWNTSSEPQDEFFYFFHVRKNELILFARIAIQLALSKIADECYSTRQMGEGMNFMFRLVVGYERRLSFLNCVQKHTDNIMKLNVDTYSSLYKIYQFKKSNIKNIKYE